MANEIKASCIYVIAGTNGAGKSSVQGARFMRLGIPYFNPDEAARRLRSTHIGIYQEEANSTVWHEGKRLLERAIAGQSDFAFETTLGGRTFTALLEKAARKGIEVRIWYVGLSSPELHIARVRQRVAAGGHDIPEGKIRERYNSSRLNLIQLLPILTELRVYDNSEESDPKTGAAPEPKLILHWARGKVVSFCDLPLTPEWAKPILAAALKASDLG